MGRIKSLLQNRTFRTALIGAAALLLLLAVWLIFGEKSSSYCPTETEARLIKLLTEIDGVESATAMVAEEDGRAVSAIVIFGGKDSLLTRSHILDITAGLLRLEKEDVQVYPAQKANH